MDCHVIHGTTSERSRGSEKSVATLFLTISLYLELTALGVPVACPVETTVARFGLLPADFTDFHVLARDSCGLGEAT
jgi:hypothetical protein